MESKYTNCQMIVVSRCWDSTVPYISRRSRLIRSHKFCTPMNGLVVAVACKHGFDLFGKIWEVNSHTHVTHMLVLEDQATRETCSVDSTHSYCLQITWLHSINAKFLIMMVSSQFNHLVQMMYFEEPIFSFLVTLFLPRPSRTASSTLIRSSSPSI